MNDINMECCGDCMANLLEQICNNCEEEDKCDCDCEQQEMPVGMPVGVGVCYMPDEIAIPLIEKMCNSGIGLSMSDLPENVRMMMRGGAIHPAMNTPRMSVDDVSDHIKKVIYNTPYTIILWNDGSKTIVKCQEGDPYYKEHGFAMAILKYVFGNTGRFNELFHKWCGEES